MAERLTEYFECGAYTEKRNVVDVSDKVRFFEDGCVMGKAINRLATFEDIMEKYDIDSFSELDKKLSDGKTWKRACELACAFLSNITQDNVCDYEDYFYQQAKKEGNDEGN